MPDDADNGRTEKKPTCFIAMPIQTHEATAEKYGDKDHWLHVMDTLFIPAVEDAGYRAVTPIATGADMIHARIVQNLIEADMVLCDMSTLNANVMFEFGVRTSLDKTIAVVAEQAKDFRLPFDTTVINTHFYDGHLRGWETRDEIRKLSEHITETARVSVGRNKFWEHFGLTLKAKEPSVDASPEEAKIDLRLSAIEESIAHLVSSDRVRTDEVLRLARDGERSLITLAPKVGELRGEEASTFRARQENLQRDGGGNVQLRRWTHFYEIHEEFLSLLAALQPLEIVLDREDPANPELSVRVGRSTEQDLEDLFRAAGKGASHLKIVTLEHGVVSGKK